MKASLRIYGILAVLFFLASFLLQGCSSLPEERKQTVPGNETTQNSKNEKTKIQFAQWSVSSAKLVEKAINGFNETNPDNIYVDVLKIPLDRYMETLNMLNSSGQGPDVYETFREWLNSYMFKNYIADLTPFIREDFLKQFPEWAIDIAQNPLYKGRFYALPSNQITYRLVYNKDLFASSGLDPERPPHTLEELKNSAKIISEYGKGKRKYGFALPLAEEWQGFVQRMEAVNGYSGVYFYNFMKGKYDLSVYKPWLSTFIELNENGGLFPGMETMKSELAQAQFAQGNIGMMYAASWEASSFLNQFPPTFDWGVALPPAIDASSAGRGAVAVNTAGWNVVNAGSAHINESVKVWKFLYSKDYLGELHKNHSAIPILGSILENPEYFPADGNYKNYLPGKDDSIYPNTPMVMEEWKRKDAYSAALFKNRMDKVLDEDTNRLDSLLGMAVAADTLSSKQYFDPGFDPKNPMKK